MNDVKNPNFSEGKTEAMMGKFHNVSSSQMVKTGCRQKQPACSLAAEQKTTWKEARGTLVYQLGVYMQNSEGVMMVV